MTPEQIVKDKYPNAFFEQRTIMDMYGVENSFNILDDPKSRVRIGKGDSQELAWENAKDFIETGVNENIIQYFL